jgi:hypothetical protein
MRTSFIVARIQDQPHVLSGGRLVPVDTADPVAFFKKVVGEGSDIGGADTIEVWESDRGIVKRSKIKPTKPAAQPEPVKGKAKK